MAALRKEDIYVTTGEYLAGERMPDAKHEYLAGAVHARSGASRAHTRISGNITAELNRRLRGKPCEAFGTDMKVRIRFGETEFFYYPDVSVECSAQADPRQVYLEAPTVLFEVLSPSHRAHRQKRKILELLPPPVPAGLRPRRSIPPRRHPLPPQRRGRLARGILRRRR